jgi:hypothetical protein
MKLEFFRQMVDKSSNIKMLYKFADCEPNRSLRTDDVQTAMTELLVAFRNLAKKPEISGL